MFNKPKKTQIKSEIVGKLLSDGLVTTEEAMVLLVEVNNQKIDVSSGGTLVISNGSESSEDITKEVNDNKERNQIARYR